MFDDVKLPNVPEDKKILSGVVIKIEEIGKSRDGGIHADIHTESGFIIETTLTPENLKLVQNRLLESAVFVVKDLGHNRYESNCVVFGKAPEYIN